MKAKTRVIIEAIKARLATITGGPSYIHTIYTVEGGQRNFDTTELAQGVCVCVAFAGSQLVGKAANAPQQQSAMELVVEGHCTADAAQDIQDQGLDLLADLEKALLGDMAYLRALPFIRPGDARIETEEIQLSEDGNAVVVTLVLSIPYIKQYAQPHEE